MADSTSRIDLRPSLGRRLGLAVAFFLLAAASAAQAGECLLAPGNHSFEMQLEGVTREYLVHVPPSCDSESPIPLVFDFHGLTDTHTGQVSFGFRQKADEAGFVVVHPQGYARSWNSGWCCSRLGLTFPSHSLDDVAFTRAMLEAIDASLLIDRERVYATGLSNGGAMSHWLACNAADMIAAVAPVAYPLSIIDDCQPSLPVAVLQIHGTADEIVPYEMSHPGSEWPSAPDSIARWAELNGCGSETERTVDLDEVYCDEYRGCDDGATAALCTVVDGPHNVYGAATQAGLHIPDAAWAFFQNKTLAVPEPGREALGLAALVSLAGFAVRSRRRRSGSAPLR